MKRITLLMAALASLFLFSGCGQSGPLYVPGNPSTMAVPPSNPDAVEQADGEQEEADTDTGTSE